MQFSFSDASAVPVVEPTAPARNRKATAAAQKQSLHAIAEASFDQPPHAEAEQSAVSELTQAAPLAVVKQTIDDLEAQGLLMLFDQHDQVAKRLTDNLISAGVLQENLSIAQPASAPSLSEEVD